VPLYTVASVTGDTLFKKASKLGTTGARANDTVNCEDVSNSLPKPVLLVC